MAEPCCQKAGAGLSYAKSRLHRQSKFPSHRAPALPTKTPLFISLESLSPPKTWSCICGAWHRLPRGSAHEKGPQGLPDSPSRDRLLSDVLTAAGMCGAPQSGHLAPLHLLQGWQWAVSLLVEVGKALGRGAAGPVPGWSSVVFLLGLSTGRDPVLGEDWPKCPHGPQLRLDGPCYLGSGPVVPASPTPYQSPHMGGAAHPCRGSG